MAKIKIITDSTADLPGEIINQYAITVLPMITSFSGVDYRDGVDLTAVQFYEHMAASTELPHTSQHSPQILYETYREALADGSSVVAIHLSSGLSGTAQNAFLAQEMLGERKRLVVLDSLSASLGQGLLTLKAAELAEAGLSLREIQPKLESMRKRLYSIFMVDTLKYLLKGGRINRLQATMGSLLDIKPILHLNPEGKIDQLDKVRGRRASLRRLVDLVDEFGQNLHGQTVGISDGVCPEEVQRFAEIFRTRFGVKKVITREIGAVIGTHTGPGAMALFFEGKPK